MASPSGHLSINGEGDICKIELFRPSLNISTNGWDRNDVLTALIHLGYLTYDFDTKMAWIPNEEIRSVMQTAITESNWSYSIKQIQRSREFMDAVQRRDSNQAAQIIEEIHDNISVPVHYNLLALIFVPYCDIASASIGFAPRQFFGSAKTNREYPQKTKPLKTIAQSQQALYFMDSESIIPDDTNPNK